MVELQVLGIPGSLRDDSYNQALLTAAQAVAPDSVDIEIVDIGDIPPFDADVEAQGDPEAVTVFKDKIRRADAILIATPEYQHGVPGVLKNALDWASRPPGDAPLQGKPAAIMGATTGSFGTARAQEQLRQTLTYNNCPTVKTPEVLVSEASDKVDANGEFTDSATLDFIGELLRELVDLTETYQNASG